MPDLTTVHADELRGDDDKRIDFDQVDPDTRLIIPTGSHRFKGKMSIPTGTLVVQAEDPEADRPVLHPPKGHNKFCVGHTGKAFIWKGVDFNVSNGVTGFRPKPSEELVVEDMKVHGRGDLDGSYQSVTSVFSIGMTDPDAVGYVRNVEVPHGSAWAHYNGGNGRVGAYISKKHVGTLVFEDCYFAEFGNNAIYGSASNGVTIADNCHFLNNNVSCFRTGAAGCIVRNCLMEVDPSKYDGPRTREDISFFMRGIWVEGKKEAEKTSGYVIAENNTIRLRNPPTRAAGIVVRPNAPGFIARENDVETWGGAIPALRGHAVDSVGNDRITHNPPSPPHDLQLEHNRFVANGKVNAVVQIDGRDFRMTDCCVEGPNANRSVLAQDNESATMTGGRAVADGGSEGVVEDGVDATGSCDDWSPRTKDGDSPAAGVDPDEETDEQDDTTDSPQKTPLETMPSHRIHLSALGSPTNFTLEASEQSRLRPGDDLESGDKVSEDGSTAEGHVAVRWGDTFIVDGMLKNAEFDGRLEVTFDDEEIGEVTADELVQLTVGPMTQEVSGVMNDIASVYESDDSGN